jgi:hypothetical protein
MEQYKRARAGIARLGSDEADRYHSARLSDARRNGRRARRCGSDALVQTTRLRPAPDEVQRGGAGVRDRLPPPTTWQVWADVLRPDAWEGAQGTLDSPLRELDVDAFWPSQNAFCRARQTCGSKPRSITSSGCSSCSFRKESRSTEIDFNEPPQRHHFSTT